MLYFLYTIHVLICLFLVLVVLLQQGSGADLSVFGGGGTQTAFGARSATNLLHRLTVAGFVGFILTTMGIGLVKAGASGSSVMTDVVQEAPAEAGATAETAADDAGEAATVEPSGDADAAATDGEAPAPSEGDEGSDG